jgi:hypothetical protein
MYCFVPFLVIYYPKSMNLTLNSPIFAEDLVEQEIPLLSSTNRTAQASESVEAKREPEAADSVAEPTAPTPPPAESTEEYLAASTDQSASEDSSLTDSDRTLVGDQENLLVQLSSEESAGQAVSSPDDPPPEKNVCKNSEYT